MQITIPNLGDGIDKADVISILVKPGDTIEKDDTLIELETDKAVAPVPAPSSGKIKEIHIKEGDKVATGTHIITLEGDAQTDTVETKTPQAAPPTAPQTIPQQPIQQPIQQQQIVAPSNIEPYKYDPEKQSQIATAPSIRAAAHAFGIDLTRIQGTGNGGRIIASDIFQYIQTIQSLAYSNQKSQPVTIPQVAQKPTLTTDFSKWGDIDIQTVSSLRTKIAEKMAEAWQTVPHVTQFSEIDITDLMAIRKKMNPKYQKEGAKLTVTVFVIKAIIEALKAFPNFNASYDQAKEELILKQYYHIGVAVDTPSGLIVPVIRDVDKKSYLELALELNEIAQKARDRKISMDALQGGTFTVSNLGGLGAGPFTPIVNTPEVAIIGLSAGKKVPTYIDGKIKERMIMPLSLSYDHRVIDGADGARFMAKVLESISSISEKELKI